MGASWNGTYRSADSIDDESFGETTHNHKYEARTCITIMNAQMRVKKLENSQLLYVDSAEGDGGNI